MENTKECMIIEAEGNCYKDIQPNNGETFTLAELQHIVGGYIEIITLPNGNLLVLNENGKLDGLPVNEKATALWKRQFAGYEGGDDIVVGNVLYCHHSLVK